MGGCEGEECENNNRSGKHEESAESAARERKTFPALRSENSLAAHSTLLHTNRVESKSAPDMGEMSSVVLVFPFR